MTPDSFTIQETFLEVGDGHTLYVHDWGNKDAKTPIIFLHGGPGGQSKDSHKGYFDPKRQRVIFHDQRGSGKSLPYASLEHNTTQDLVADIEKIADKFKLTEFIITGGSWGSCLALAYALEHQDRLKALVLHGVWTSSKSENDWLDKGGFQRFFPDAWQRYLDQTPKSHHANPSSYHFDRALNGTSAEAKASGYAYEQLEGSVVKLDDRGQTDDFETYDPSGIRIEIQYLQNLCFMPDRHILNNASKIKVPVYMVQGRYDMVCPPATAFELSQKLPNNELIWTTSGHVAEREAWNVIRTILLQLTENTHA